MSLPAHQENGSHLNSNYLRVVPSYEVDLATKLGDLEQLLQGPFAGLLFGAKPQLTAEIEKNGTDFSLKGNRPPKLTHHSRNKIADFFLKEEQRELGEALGPIGIAMMWLSTVTVGSEGYIYDLAETVGKNIGVLKEKVVQGQVSTDVMIKFMEFIGDAHRNDTGIEDLDRIHQLGVFFLAVYLNNPAILSSTNFK
jgi:hypothetical protein